MDLRPLNKYISVSKTTGYPLNILKLKEAIFNIGIKLLINVFNQMSLDANIFELSIEKVCIPLTKHSTWENQREKHISLVKSWLYNIFGNFLKWNKFVTAFHRMKKQNRGRIMAQSFQVTWLQYCKTNCFQICCKFLKKILSSESLRL